MPTSGRLWKSVWAELLVPGGKCVPLAAQPAVPPLGYKRDDEQQTPRWTSSSRAREEGLETLTWTMTWTRIKPAKSSFERSPLHDTTNSSGITHHYEDLICICLYDDGESATSTWRGWWWWPTDN